MFIGNKTDCDYIDLYLVSRQKRPHRQCESKPNSDMEKYLLLLPKGNYNIYFLMKSNYNIYDH